MAETPLQAAELPAKFHQNLDCYRGQVYNETQVRLEFINPLFEAPGWDVANKAGYGETRLQRESDATDRQIDQLAYELYGLTEAERLPFD